MGEIQGEESLEKASPAVLYPTSAMNAITGHLHTVIPVPVP